MPMHRLTRWLSALAVGAAPAAAAAQGFTLNELGSCAVARGYAVTSTPCKDASNIYWNPAALTMLNGLSVYGGVASIDVNGKFTQDTTGTVYPGVPPTAYSPHLFINWTNRSTSMPIAVGVGAYVPYGLTSQWNEDFPGRFFAQKGALRSIYIQPNIAIGLGRSWSVGGGPVFGHSTIELRQSVDLSSEPTGTTLPNGAPVTFAMLGIAPGTEFARGRVKGSANKVGFNVGLHGEIGDVLHVGVRYLSKMNFEYKDADATFTAVPTGLTLTASNPLNLPTGTPVDAVVASQFTSGALQNQTATVVGLVHPWQLQFGVGFTGIANTTLSFDVMRTGWKDFQTVNLTFSNAATPGLILNSAYQDNWAYRAGIEYRISGSTIGLKNGLALRGGFSAAETPVPGEAVTPLLPDMRRRNWSAGLGLPLGDVLSVDAAYLRVDTPGRRGNVTGWPGGTVTAEQLNSGYYQLNANIFSVSLKASF